MGLLRTILVIVIIYYFFKMISRYIMPIVLKKAVNKMQQNAQQRQQAQQPDKNVNVGETIIDKKPMKSAESNNSVGEYVDYEEVD